MVVYILSGDYNMVVYILSGDYNMVVCILSGDYSMVVYILSGDYNMVVYILYCIANVNKIQPKNNFHIFMVYLAKIAQFCRITK